jgi:hypothetical protein
MHRFRAPRLVLVSGLGSQLLTVWLLVYLLIQSSPDFGQLQENVWCPSWYWIAPLGYTFLLAPYALRFYRVVNIFNSASAGPVVNAKYWDQLVVSEARLLQIFFALAVAVLVTETAVLLSDYEPDFTGYNCSDRYTLVNWVSFLVFNLIEVIGCLVVIVVLRRAPDQFYMVRELEVTSACWFICTVGTMVSLWIVNGEFPLGNAHVKNEIVFFNANAVFMILKNLLSFGASVLWPLVLSRSQSDFVPLWSSTDALGSLERVLKDVVCMEYFRQFMTAEEREEYILCWIEIEIFKDACERGEDDETLLVDAWRIYERYLRENTELEVPVSVSARRGIQLVLDRHAPISETVFSTVQAELFNLMAAYFSSFLCSQSCRSCLEDLEKEAALKLMFTDSGMI